MTTERTQFEVNELVVDLVRKDIKNLHLAVYPPNGRVRVAAPHRLGHEAIRLAVVSRLGWIRSQRARFERQDRQSEREFVNGESHFFLGRRYRLRVTEAQGRGEAKIIGKSTLELSVRAGASRDQREWILSEWYRQELRAAVPTLLTKWAKVIGAQPASVGIRRMKTRWGTCNWSDRRVRQAAGRRIRLLNRLLP